MQGPAHIEVMIRPGGGRAPGDLSSGCDNTNGSSASSSIGSSRSSDSDSINSSDSTSEIVLIEANCGRWHGQDTVPLCNAAYGYNAPTLSIIALLAAAEAVAETVAAEVARVDGGTNNDNAGGDSFSDAMNYWHSIPKHPPIPKVSR